jgi:tetratricopeptide (TPR) repeat protein
LIHGERIDPHRRAEAERDLGIVLCRDGPKAAAVALPLLEASLATWPDDLTAREAEGFALGQLHRFDAGLAAFRAVLDREPARESALIGAADLAARAGRLDDAIANLRRAIAINPWRSAYHADLASLCFRNRDWPAAAAACRDAIRLSPNGPEPRKLLVRCLLRLEDMPIARRELQTLLAFDPPDRDELTRWFSSLARPESCLLPSEACAVRRFRIDKPHAEMRSAWRDAEPGRSARTGSRAEACWSSPRLRVKSVRTAFTAARSIHPALRGCETRTRRDTGTDGRNSLCPR